MKINKYVKESYLFNFLKVSKLISNKISKELRLIDIGHVQALVLITIYFEQKGVSAKDLSLTLQMSKSSLSYSISLLEEKGLITRVLSQYDNRSFNFMVTPKGKEAAVYSINIFERVDKELERLFSSKNTEKILEDFTI